MLIVESWLTLSRFTAKDKPQSYYIILSFLIFIMVSLIYISD